jgi:HEAT repeat protein
MPRLLDEMRGSDRPPREVLSYLAERIGNDPSLLDDFESSLLAAKTPEKGTCVEALELLAKEHPEYVLPHLASVMACLADKAPRVRWEAARVIANVAPRYPERAAEATDRLLVNAHDEGTVVRWSAALALGEILKANEASRATLQPLIEELSGRESNNGVRNHYVKALKRVGAVASK